MRSRSLGFPGLEILLLLWAIVTSSWHCSSSGFVDCSRLQCLLSHFPLLSVGTMVRRSQLRNIDIGWTLVFGWMVWAVMGGECGRHIIKRCAIGIYSLVCSEVMDLKDWPPWLWGSEYATVPTWPSITCYSDWGDQPPIANHRFLGSWIWLPARCLFSLTAKCWMLWSFQSLLNRAVTSGIIICPCNLLMLLPGSTLRPYSVVFSFYLSLLSSHSPLCRLKGFAVPAFGGAIRPMTSSPLLSSLVKLGRKCRLRSFWC